MPDNRDQLKAVREQLATLRAERTKLARQKADVRGKMDDVDFSQSGKEIFNSSAFKEAEQIVAREGQNADEINRLEGVEHMLMRLNGESEQQPIRTGGPNGFQPGAEQSIGWNGHRLLAESDAYREGLESGLFASGANKFGTVTLGKVCTRDELGMFLSPYRQAAIPTAPAGDRGTDQGVVVPDVRGIFPPALQPLTLLDLIPTGTTDSNIIQYVQVSALPGYAAETAELAVKPAEGLAFVDATAPVRTIAGYQKLARQALDDMAGLATLINTLIPWDVRRRLQNQMLYGDGTGVNLLGIANTSGIGAPASVAGDNIADGILRAATTIVLADGDPQFVAINPTSWQNMLLVKATTNQYVFGDIGDTQGGPDVGVNRPFGIQSIWGLRVIQNRLVPAAAGGPLVGDPIGATLLVREGVNIKTSDSDQDDFIRNRITILGECRVALPVWRPAGFAKAPLG